MKWIHEDEMGGLGRYYEVSDLLNRGPIVREFLMKSSCNLG